MKYRSWVRPASVALEGEERNTDSRQRGLDERADPQLEQDQPQGQPERQLGRQPQSELCRSGVQGLLGQFKGLDPAAKHATDLMQVGFKL
jgi:hypothetical protein